MRPEAILALTIILLTTTLAPGGIASGHRDVNAACTGTTTQAVVEDFSITYPGGETVSGCLAYPTAGKSGVTTLVVVTHGVGWTVQDGWTGHMTEIVARAPGTAVLAMNFRDNFGFPVMQGAEDVVRGTLKARSELATGGATVEQTVLLGVSMGSAVSGTAIRLAPSITTTVPLYDYWFDVEGVSNLFETYAAARAAAPAVPFAAEVVAGIERDAGGAPHEVPRAYAYRSPALSADAMAAAGLEGAIVIHGVNDGLVPYNQGREMVAALQAAQVPVEFITVTRGEADHTSGTTPTSHALPAALDPNEQFLHLAGHASEGDRGHVVMDVAIDRLVDFLASGHLHQYGETVHDAGPTPSLV